jgi:hypothetical protein
MSNRRLAIIVDLDGTLFDTSAVAHYVNGTVKPKDFKAFYDYACTEAPLHLGVRRVCNAFRAITPEYYAIVLLTGRPEAYHCATVTQLARHEFVYDRLYMRADNDRRPNAVMKLDRYDTEISQEFNPYLVVDDNPIAIKMWQDRGVVTLAVNDFNTA